MIITNTLPRYVARITLKPTEEMTIKNQYEKPLLSGNIAVALGVLSVIIGVLFAHV